MLVDQQINKLPIRSTLTFLLFWWLTIIGNGKFFKRLALEFHYFPVSL